VGLGLTERTPNALDRPSWFVSLNERGQCVVDQVLPILSRLDVKIFGIQRAAGRSVAELLIRVRRNGSVATKNCAPTAGEHRFRQGNEAPGDVAM
jgi:DNA-binding MarR family transcriptional regulator